MINWGIIGCGSVTEVKSGPAFNHINGSSLVAVMSRDMQRAKDYSSRHGVPAYYNNGHELINDPSVNAIYIATPPASHEEWCNAAIEAGKPVYVEKPMALNYSQAIRIADLARIRNINLSVAHYRRAQPLFTFIKQLLGEGTLGLIKSVQSSLMRPLLSKDDLKRPATQWRLNPAISGGGLFHDLAPHQLDLMLWYFGDITSCSGYSSNNNEVYSADDYAEGEIYFKSGVVFKGLWNFNNTVAKDECIITGTRGIIQFSFFKGDSILLKTVKGEEILRFPVPYHAQLPMIKRVVAYFSNKGANPCSGHEGAEVLKIMDSFTGNNTEKKVKH